MWSKYVLFYNFIKYASNSYYYLFIQSATSPRRETLRGPKVNIRHGAATVQVAQKAPVYQAMPAAPVQAAPAPAPAAAPKAEAPVATADNLITIKSPMIGTFYRSSGPGKPTFVNVGDEIKAGQVICIIEAMKLFNEIESEMSGTIVKVLVEDGTSVEYDQPLFLVQP